LWVDIERHPDLETYPDVILIRVEARLFFANADFVKERIEALCTDTTRVVVLDAETSPFVDVSAAEMLVQLRDTLARRNIELRIARDIGQFRDTFRQASGGEHPVAVYASVTQAISDTDKAR